MRLLSLLALSVSRTRFATIVATALLAASCDKMPLLAPSGTTITLVVSSTVVPVNGSTTIAASVIESAGTPVQNGTVVTFVSSFGRLEPAEARTENGKATVRFIAGSQSGTARITAFSGGVSASTTADNDIKIGGAAADRILGRADPASVPIGATTTIVATVLDVSGNPLAGVPVTFTTDAGQLSQISAVTDANGEARSTLTVTRTTRVTLAAGNKSVDVTVTPVPAPAVSITPPASLEAGVPATFTIAPVTATGGNPIQSVVINWGDGTPPTSLGAIVGTTPVSHAFPSPSTYQIVATVTDTQGFQGVSSIVVNVVERATVPVTVTASTTNPTSFGTTQGIVTFTCQATPPAGGGTVTFYDWTFGDGGSSFATGPTYPYRYQAPGTFVVRCRVRTTTGAEGFGELTYRLNP